MHCIGAQHLRGQNSYHRKAESNMIILLLGLLQLGQSNQIKATGTSGIVFLHGLILGRASNSNLTFNFPSVQ